MISPSPLSFLSDQTEAVLDVEKDEWIIHTPDEGAIKWWIGNAAEDGRAATVFARLKIGDADHGVHAFIVPLRDTNGSLLPGVDIKDCGYKVVWGLSFSADSLTALPVTSFPPP